MSRESFFNQTVTFFDKFWGKKMMEVDNEVKEVEVEEAVKEQQHKAILLIGKDRDGVYEVSFEDNSKAYSCTLVQAVEGMLALSQKHLLKEKWQDIITHPTMQHNPLLHLPLIFMDTISDDGTL